MTELETTSVWHSEARRIRRPAFLLAVSFAVVEGAIRAFDLYRRLPWVDVPSHLLSGAAVTALIMLYLTRHGVSRRIRWSWLGNMTVALGWEVAETLDEIVSPDPVHLQDVFLWDGVGDVGSALVGGSVFLWAISKGRRRQNAVTTGAPPGADGPGPTTANGGVDPRWGGDV